MLIAFILRYSPLSSRLTTLACDSTWVNSFYSAFLNIHQSGVIHQTYWIAILSDLLNGNAKLPPCLLWWILIRPKFQEGKSELGLVIGWVRERVLFLLLLFVCVCLGGAVNLHLAMMNVTVYRQHLYKHIAFMFPIPVVCWVYDYDVWIDFLPQDVKSSKMRLVFVCVFYDFLNIYIIIIIIIFGGGRGHSHNSILCQSSEENVQMRWTPGARIFLLT